MRGLKAVAPGDEPRAECDQRAAWKGGSAHAVVPAYQCFLHLGTPDQRTFQFMLTLPSQHLCEIDVDYTALVNCCRPTFPLPCSLTEVA